MSVITLPDKGKTYNADFAADSVFTGNFVALILSNDMVDVFTAFNNPGRILVDEPDVGRHEYTGFDTLERFERSVEPEGYTIVLSKSQADQA